MFFYSNRLLIEVDCFYLSVCLSLVEGLIDIWCVFSVSEFGKDDDKDGDDDDMHDHDDCNGNDVNIASFVCRPRPAISNELASCAMRESTKQDNSKLDILISPLGQPASGIWLLRLHSMTTQN